MTHRRRGARCCGPRRGRPPVDRESWLRVLEEYQRDLERETADVADLIRRLRDEGPTGTATV